MMGIFFAKAYLYDLVVEKLRQGLTWCSSAFNSWKGGRKVPVTPVCVYFNLSLTTAKNALFR